MNEKLLRMLRRIAGTELEEGEVYDETFIGSAINEAAAYYSEVERDRDRIRAQYINDFTKPSVAEEEVISDIVQNEEKKEAPTIKIEDYLNL